MYLCHWHRITLSLISKSFWMWIIFELLEGLEGFGKFRLAEMKSHPSAELDFSDSATIDTNRKSNTAKEKLYNAKENQRCKTMLEMPEGARKWRQLQEHARKKARNMLRIGWNGEYLSRNMYKYFSKDIRPYSEGKLNDSPLKAFEQILRHRRALS